MDNEEWNSYEASERESVTEQEYVEADELGEEADA